MTRSLAPLLLAAAACAHGPSSSPGGRTGASSSPSEVRAGARPSDAGARSDRREPEPASKPVAPAAVLEEVTGVVRTVDRKAHTFTVQAGGGEVTLTVDRNTMVYTPAGLGTVADLVPGARVRAGRNADLVAYWVQVRGPPRSEPGSTPGQGTGPAGGAGAPPEGGRGPAGGGGPGGAGSPGTSLPGPTGAGPGAGP